MNDFKNTNGYLKKEKELFKKFEIKFKIYFLWNYQIRTYYDREIDSSRVRSIGLFGLKIN